MQDLGWGGDHVGKLVALQTSVRRLCGSGKMRERFDAATFALATFQESDFPEPLRAAYTRVMEARRKSRRDINPRYAVFAFDELTPTERKQIVADVIALYEACLIDIGRTWPQWDFVYPKGDVLTKPKRHRSQ